MLMNEEETLKEQGAFCSSIYLGYSLCVKEKLILSCSHLSS